MEGGEICVNSDGETSRSFNFITNAVQANDKALFTDKSEALNQVYNTACGDQVTLNEIVAMLRQIANREVPVTHGPERPRDVRHGRADVSKIESFLEYHPEERFREGLEKAYNWYKETYYNG